RRATPTQLFPYTTLFRSWFDGIEMIKQDPTGSYNIVGKALKLDAETVSGMLSGLKLTPYADNAQFYGLAGGKPHYETLFDTAFVDRKSTRLNSSHDQISY